MATGNGHGNGVTAEAGGRRAVLDHRHILVGAARVQARRLRRCGMREDLTGVDGQIAETFNELVEMVKTIRDEANDVSTAVGKEGQAAKRMRRLNTVRRLGRVHHRRSTRSSRTSPATRTRSRASSPPWPAATSSRRWRSRTAATGRGAASSCATRGSSTAWSPGSSQFGSEVTRVAQEVGGEGKLGAQARVQGVVRRVEGPHRLREPDGVEPDVAGPRDRARDHGRRAGRPDQDRSRSTSRARSSSSRTRSTRWSSSSARSRTR